MLSLLLYVSLANSYPKNPTNSLANALILEKGLIKANAPGDVCCASWSAIPVPIDLPMTMMSFSLKPSLLTI